jgi:hypothetical protein
MKLMNFFIMTSLMCFAASVFAQQKKAVTKVNPDTTTAVFLAVYDGGDIVLSYHPLLPVRTDSVVVNVYRKGLDGEKLLKTDKKIPTSKNYKFADTSLRKHPGTYQYTLKAKIDTTVVATESVWANAFAPDIRPIASMFRVTNIKGTNNIVLKWKIDNNFWIHNITVQRSRSKTGVYEPVANLGAQDTLFVDKVFDANEPFYYRLDMAGESNERVYSSTSVFVNPEFTIVPAVVGNVKAVQKNDAIVVSWSNDDEFARGYYVKKRSQNMGDFRAASGLILKNRSNQYLWKDTLSSLSPREMYQYVVVAESNSFDRSGHSDTATVSFNYAGKTLSPPSDLRILTVNDTTYHLAWSVDSLRKDEVASYQLYFKKTGETVFRPLENGLVASNTNYVEIAKPRNGDQYKVKSINGNLESGFSLPLTYTNAFEKEFGPKYLKAAVIDQALNIKWLKSETLSVKVYKLYRWNGTTFILIETIPPGKDLVVTKNYVAGEVNLYQLKTVNMQNVESNGSKVLQVN